MFRTAPDITTTPAAQLAALVPVAEAAARRFGRYSPWLADDLLSDALLRLWRTIAAGKLPPNAPRAFAWVICERACYNRIEKERARNRAAFRRAGPVRSGDGTETPFVDTLADGRDGPDVDAAEEAAAALKLLPPAVRALLVQNAVNGVSMEALAEEAGVSTSRVGQRLAAAKARVRGRMGAG